jgi:hypothetical protein
MLKDQEKCKNLMLLHLLELMGIILNFLKNIYLFTNYPYVLKSRKINQFSKSRLFI